MLQAYNCGQGATSAMSSKLWRIMLMLGIRKAQKDLFSYNRDLDKRVERTPVKGDIAIRRTRI